MLTIFSTEQGKAWYSLWNEVGCNKELVCASQIWTFEDFSKWYLNKVAIVTFYKGGNFFITGFCI